MNLGPEPIAFEVFRLIKPGRPFWECEPEKAQLAAMLSNLKSSFTVRQILTPSETDIDNAVNVLTAAFEKDDCTAIFIGRDPAMAAPFQRMKVTAGLLAGEVYVAEDIEKNMIGVAIWFAPGREMFDSEDQLEEALQPFTSHLCTEMREWWNTWWDEFSPEYNAFMASSLGTNAIRDGWTLQVIGILPEHHHKGVAKALVSIVREKADAEGIAMCLEAEQPHNVGIYECLGFKIKGNKDFSNIYGSFSVWAMRYDPLSRVGAPAMRVE